MNCHPSETRLSPSFTCCFALLIIYTFAITACSRTSPATSTSVAPIVTDDTQNPLPDLAEAASAGRPLFLVHCAMCHGEDGKGEGAAGNSLAVKPTNLTTGEAASDSDGKLFLAVKNGIKREGKQTMPPAKQVPDEQIWQIVAYVKALGKK